MVDESTKPRIIHYLDLHGFERAEVLEKLFSIDDLHELETSGVIYLATKEGEPGFRLARGGQSDE